MPFSKLSPQEAQEILTAAGDPAYRAMNRAEAELARRCSSATPEENVLSLIGWLRALQRLGVVLEPSRELPATRISLL